MKKNSLILLLLLLQAVPVRMSAERTVEVRPGQLQSIFDAYDLMYEFNLTLKGKINGSDIKVLREWSNSQRVLNLYDCRIVAGGDPYYEDYTTEDDVIGPYMFYEKEFQSLVLPNVLTKIGDYAFFFCGDSINLSPTLTWVGDHAFSSNFFERLHIPASLVHIGNGAFNGNRWLQQVTMDEDNPEYVLEDGYLYTRDHTRLLSFFNSSDTSLESITIRPEVKIIDDMAFNYNCCNNITLNEGLQYIGDDAFRCALRQVWQPKLVIPNSVTHIGAGAFNECYMDSLIISDNVEYLQDWSFHECFIEYIHLPEKLKHIGEYALCNNQLYNLVLPEGLETIDEHAFSDLRVSKLVIPSSVRDLAPNAFWDFMGGTLEILAPLDSIPSGCFYNCEGLNKLILPPTIKRIGGTAFYECYNLIDCKLPEGLEEIGVEAFAGADYLVDWHIPASVRKIEFGAFFVPNYSAHNIYMYSKEPPAETDPMAFNEPMDWMSWNMAESVLYVPEGCIENYQQTVPWNSFGTIREFNATNVKSLPRAHEKMTLRSFDLNGRPIPDSQRGLHIVRTPDGVKKVLK